jgi:NAD(P)-dependent dehydrogenase (short-subunit alcohol dehydrogenase family)
MTADQRLSQHVALITGGGGEIGSAIAMRLAKEGASVGVADIESDKAQKTADSIKSFGGRAHAITLDVRSEEQAARAVRECVTVFDKLTVLINVAAAVTPDGNAETIPLDVWENAIRVNLTGAFLMCKFAVPEIRKAGGGSIINIASQLGHLSVAGRSPYCTTKAALIKYTQMLALDYARDHIRANSISPGFILTERSSKRSGGKEKADRIQGPKHLLNRTGRVEDIAAGAAYLVSDDAAFVTGTDLLIDGGYVTFKGVIGLDGVPTM